MKVVVTNDKVRIVHNSFKNKKANMIKISNDSGVNAETGELIEFKHAENRSENLHEFGISLSKLRDLILTNVLDPDKCYFITLTYKKEDVNQKELNYDLNKFIARLKRKYGKFEYINTVEVQGRGTWHCHMILIFNTNKTVENIEIEQCWGLGLTTTRQIDSAESVARYLTNYIFNFQENVVEQEEIYKDKKQKKAERIAMYPPKFNLFRYSKGIQKPIVERNITYQEAKEKYSLEALQYATGMLCDKKSSSKNFITVENYLIEKKE